MYARQALRLREAENDARAGWHRTATETAMRVLVPTDGER
jgi:hypothetical protein